MKYTQQTTEQKKNLKAALNTAPSVNAMLQLLQKNYDLDNCKPGIITKSMLADSLVNTVLPMINPEVK